MEYRNAALITRNDIEAIGSADAGVKDAGCARGPDSFTKGLRIGVAIDGENLRVFFCLPPQVDVVADEIRQRASVGSGY